MIEHSPRGDEPPPTVSIPGVRAGIAAVAVGYAALSVEALLGATRTSALLALDACVAATAGAALWRAGRAPTAAASLAAAAMWLHAVAALALDSPTAARAVFPVLAAVGMAIVFRSMRGHGVGGDRLAGARPAGSAGAGRPEDDAAAREREDRRVHAQRLECLGHLVSGVAHELGNVLAVVEANAELVAASADVELREAGRDLQAAGRWGKAIVRELLVVSRRDEREAQRVDLAAAATDTSRFLGRVLRAHRLDVVADGPVPVVACPGHLEQILMNLVMNARDAMPGGGTIRVRVARLARTAAAELGSELAGPDQALLEVEDRGVGMTPETLARLFEPFFTTKPRGMGTGLGLRTVADLVARTGGNVSVTSAPGHGSRFRVFLPVAATGEAGAP